MKSDDTRATILIDKYVEAAAGTNVVGYNYKGLYIHTAPGLHDFVAERIGQFFTVSGKVLELGAGTGAMSLRLLDMGFNVTATDYVAENFRLPGEIPFITCDLNKDFANEFVDQFDGITAIEIIEHLENPRHFLRQCFRALKPGGQLLLTTPNTDNAVSKAMFLRTGEFLWFSDLDYRREGHMTPLSQWQLRKCAEEVNFELVSRSSFGDPFRHLTQWRKMRYLARIISRIARNTEVEDGEIYVAVWRKPKDPKGADGS